MKKNAVLLLSVGVGVAGVAAGIAAAAGASFFIIVAAAAGGAVLGLTAVAATVITKFRNLFKRNIEITKVMTVKVKRNSHNHDRHVLVYNKEERRLPECDSSESEEENGISDRSSGDFQDDLEALKKIRQLIKSRPSVSSEDRAALYGQLIEVMVPLIDKHSAWFSYSKSWFSAFIDWVSNARPIFLNVGGDTIELKDDLRDFFQEIICQHLQHNPEQDYDPPIGRDFPCIIYCFCCTMCPNSRFVGQTINKCAPPENLQEHIIIKRKKSPLMAEHMDKVHPTQKPEDVYEMKMLHDLQDNTYRLQQQPIPTQYQIRRAKKDKRIRRTWEMFYQWIYKAMKYDGGLNKK